MSLNYSELIHLVLERFSLSTFQMLRPQLSWLALVAVVCLFRPVDAAPSPAQLAYSYSTNENQVSINQQRRISQEKLHRAVSRFAATGRGIAGVTEYVMKAVDR